MTERPSVTYSMNAIRMISEPLGEHRCESRPCGFRIIVLALSAWPGNRLV